jgi:hypothetical protein
VDTAHGMARLIPRMILANWNCLESEFLIVS